MTSSPMTLSQNFRCRHGDPSGLPPSRCSGERSLDDASAASNALRAQQPCLPVDPDIGTPSRCFAADLSEDPLDLFHRPVVVDVGQHASPGGVRVAGKGVVSLDWPKGHVGVEGREGVFRMVPISYAIYHQHLRVDSLPKVCSLPC